MNCGAELRDGRCGSCELPFSGQYCVGRRDGALKVLINEFKFKSVRANGRVLADLMAARLGKLGDVRIVAVPTIARHVRERGFDHMALLGKELARRCSGTFCAGVLERNKNTTQVGADMEMRILQAREAFRIGKKMEPGADYLLLDDV